MTQENKELLIRDLCARVPYGVKYMRYSWNYDIDQELPVIETLECVDKDGYINHRRVYTVDDIKPYLFPLSSMTEEQKKYIADRWGINEDFDFDIDPNWGEYFVDLCDVVDYVNWLIENHFDFNWLIPKGLANDATELNIY